MRSTGNGDAQPFFVVCGDDPLAHDLVEELTTRYKARVTVILPSRRQNYGPRLAAKPGVTVVESPRLDEAAFRAAGLHNADGLALVQQDEAGNIHAALRAQEIKPRLRLVIRMFNMSLGHGVRRLLGDCAVLSDASMAAPELVAAALGVVAPHFVRLPGRTVYVARRADVHPADVVCGIATTSGSGAPEVLPADDRQTDLVLAVANRRGQAPPPPAEWEDEEAVPDTSRSRRRARRRRRILAIGRAMLSLVDSKLEIAALVLVIVFLIGVIGIGLTDHLTPWQAVYTAMITALDAGDADLQSTPVRQVLHAFIALTGIALVPVLTAAVVNAAVNARLARVLGHLRHHISGHFVVIGLGYVGTRVTIQLHDLGYEVVAIDRSEDSRGAQLVRDLGIPLIIGDATKEETLRHAAVRTCRGVLALSSSDVVNLEAALHARNIQPNARVVLRLFDADFARRVEQVFDFPISRSVSSLAAPAFAAALLEREVIGMIAVRRRVLVIAEVVVAPGSTLAGRQVAQVAEVGRVRVIALTRAGSSEPIWIPKGGAQIKAGDQLLVITTRTGLSEVLASAAPPNPPDTAK